MRSPGDHVWAIANTSRKEKSEDIGTVKRLVLQPQDGWTTAEVRLEQLKDSDIVQILEAKENGDQRPCLQEVSDKSPGLKALWGPVGFPHSRKRPLETCMGKCRWESSWFCPSAE
jgi:hypothetical protein